ncbi:MAG TPA: DUF4177 domain-containing protein [Anaeromyxobacteraceae bacterium]|nr:DUF4177 domain-containing protein [Anaeromyxobacteraceae bacterium]
MAASERGEGAYRVVEVSPVGEETLERALNERAAEGWAVESIHFVMRDGSHRPSMAYLFFTRSGARARPPGAGGG